MNHRVETTRQRNGRLTTIVYNARGVKVADIQDHNFSLEDILIAVRQFRAEHPELFGDALLVDTADESQRKNPDEYGDGKLETIPEG